MTEVIANDLKRSGLFRPLDPASYVDQTLDAAAVPNFQNWRAIDAQALVAGTLTREPDGRLKAEFRLWDVFAAEQMIGQQYYTQPDNWRRLAHIIADAIYERLTGEKGYFDTRVVFVSETGPKNDRTKRLAIMDQDGANVRYLTRGDDLVLTPRFSPSSQDVTYMSYSGGHSERLSPEHRDRRARGPGQFPRDDVRAALLAGRTTGGDEPSAGGQRQHLRHGSGLAAHDAADQFRLH